MSTLKKIILSALVITMLTIVGAEVYQRYFSRRRLIISTTTSLYETGLLDAIEKEFEARHQIDVNLISAGTGIALLHAERGDADVVLVHSPTMEKAFLEKGIVICRKIVAYNFFLIVGPATDPARINGTDVITALKRILDYGRNQTSRVWISRGDNSGTHSKEVSLWQRAGYDYAQLPRETWYASTGSGMAATLLMANEFSAYTLTDMGTYLAYYREERVNLIHLVSQGRDLLNVYSVMAVSPTVQANQSLHPQINFRDAVEFINFLISEEGQQLIENYGKDKYGQSLFYGAVGLLKENPPSQIAQWIKDYAFLNGTECPTE